MTTTPTTTTPTTTTPTGTSAFEEFETTGWERQASGYDGFLTEITSRAAGALLDAAGVGPGTRLLDIASGPGHVAGMAAARGAVATGIDIAESMLAIARPRWPDVEFRQADAHQLPFPDASFDAVTAGFALLHLGRPEQAVSEFVRVLVPGGTLAVTVWDEPQRTALFDAVLAALDASGATPPPDIPDGPAFFRFSSDGAIRTLLDGQGLVNVAVTTLGFTHRVIGAEQVWNGILDGTVRTAALITGQTDDVRRRIQEAFVANLERRRRGDHLELPVSVKLATGVAPARAAAAAT
jgi:SAM-dependent methyltransferase